MTVIGFGIGALQLFVRYPVWPIREASPQRADQVPPGRTARQLPDLGHPASSRETARIPVMYGLAFFASALLTVIGEFSLLAAGNRVTGPSINNFAIALVAADLLYAIGLPGFHALQRDTPGGTASLFGCVCAATGTIIGGLSLWVYADGFNQSAAIPPSFHELAIVSNWVAILADLLLAYAILRARVYPSWTAVLLVIGAILSWTYVHGYDTPAWVTVYRLDTLVGCIPLVVFAYYMVQRRRSFA